jgi:vacuolar-type H+-ATPase subunit I/STV1
LLKVSNQSTHFNKNSIKTLNDKVAKIHQYNVSRAELSTKLSKINNELKNIDRVVDDRHLVLKIKENNRNTLRTCLKHLDTNLKSVTKKISTLNLNLSLEGFRNISENRLKTGKFNTLKDKH